MIGRKGVRAYAAAFFGNGAVVGLNTVYPGEPRSVPNNAYFLNAGPKSGAVGWPYVETQYEKRIGYQEKQVIYEIAFAIRFVSYNAKAEDALDDHDAIIDAFCVLLRSDRRLGTSNNPAGQVLFQAGEGDTVMGNDIHVMTGPGPKTRKADGPIIIWSMVRFMATEMIQS